MIGWRELAAFPDLGVDRIHAKIDTGAKTSAIHAFRVHPIDIDGAPGVEFFLHPRRRRKKPEIYCRAPIVGKRVIRSSNGVEQERYVIATHMRIGGRTWKIDLTLADRDAMGYRLLIGRDAMRRRFVIDPGASYLLNEDFYAEKESR
ncbi:MAG: RimK/LysX family protein [Pseudomonadota bacterium]